MTSQAKIVVSAEDRNTARVFGRVRAEIQSAGKSAEGLRAGLSLLAPAVAGALSIAGIAAFVKGANDGLLKIKDLSEATGASIENISGLENVARAAGGSLQDVSGILVKFNGALKDADGKNSVSLALQAIGLSAKELRDIDPAEALQRTALALAGFEDNGNKARIVQELFGKSIKDAGPLLRELAEAGRLNATVTADQVEQADKLTKEFAKLGNNAEDLARALLGPVATAMNQTIEKFREGQKEGKGFFETLRGEQFRLLGQLFNRGQADDIGKINARIAELNSLLDTPRRQSLFSGQATELETERKALQSAADTLRKVNYGNEGRARPRPSLPSLADAGGGGGATGNKAAAQSDADRYLETLRKQLQGTQDLTLTETVLAEIRGGSLKTASASEQKRALGLAAEIEGTKETIRLARERSDQRNSEYAEIDKFVAAQQAANDQRVRSILNATPTAQLKAALGDIELIGKEFDAGRISAEQWAEAVKGISAPLAAAGEEVQKLGTFAEQAGRNIQDALGDTIKDTLTGDFESIGDRWRDLLVNMAAEAAAAQLNQALFGGLFGGGGKGVGLIGDLFTGIAGARASGGPVSSGRAYLVGERGPEIMVPSQGGTVLPNGQGLGGGSQVIVHNHINGDVSPATVKLVEGAMSRVKADILRSSRQGGAYGGAY